MKKFNFRLEKIRKYKKQVEQNEKLRLARKQAHYFTEKSTLKDIISVKNRYFSSYGIRRPGKIDINFLVNFKKYIDKLSTDIVRQTEKVAESENDMTEAQKILLNASREKKKYDKLRERYLRNYNREYIRSETRELDEFGARAGKNKTFDISHG